MKKLSAVVWWSIYVLILLIITFALHTFCLERTIVSGESMLPTLNDGDQLIADKLSYRFRDPKRYEIIVFPHGNEYYIKRIIGLPGETVRISDGVIYINDAPLQDTHALSAMVNPGEAADPITLPPDSYFVLGDNRNASIDSRMSEVGNIKKSALLGRCAFRIYPFDKFGFVK